MRHKTQFAALLFTALMLAGLTGLNGGLALAALQTPLPTETLQPTATFGGPTVLASEQVNVRAGPGTNYDQVGVLIPGQTAPAIGRSPGNEWIQIEYPGGPGNRAWVFAPLVSIRAGTIEDLTPAETPPPPTAPPTPTFDTSLVTPGTSEPTRMPTFTAAAPVVQATFEAPDLGGGGFPPAIAIIGLFVIGVFAGVVAVLRQRS
jgi:hypothetical protein